MTAPTPPRGAVAAPPRRLARSRGEIACWQHSARLPNLEVSLRAAGEHGGYPEQPAHVRVGMWHGRIDAADAAELRQIAWTILAAASWLERQQGRQPAEPDPQLTIYDQLEDE